MPRNQKNPTEVEIDERFDLSFDLETPCPDEFNVLDIRCESEQFDDGDLRPFDVFRFPRDGFTQVVQWKPKSQVVVAMRDAYFTHSGTYWIVIPLHYWDDYQKTWRHSLVSHKLVVKL